MNDEIDAYRQPTPRFDPTINYGHILTAVSFIVAGAGAYYGMLSTAYAFSYAA